MKNLTISTEGALLALARRTRRLPAPRDYFVGRQVSAPVMPNDLLFFARRHGRELGGFPHAHHRFVLITALQGRGSVVVDQTAHVLQPGRALLIFPFQFHYYTDIAPGPLTWLFTTFELPSDEPLAELRGVTRTLTDSALRDLERGCAAFRTNERTGSSRRRAYDGGSDSEMPLRIALVLASLLGVQERVVAPRASSRGAQSELLERVGRYVFTHLQQPIAVGELARGLGMSETHLREQLRTRYRLSPHGYIRHVKMLQAMRLIRSAEKSVSEIAEALGYSSLFAFSRTFKLETGLSPRQYGRQHAR